MYRQMLADKFIVDNAIFRCLEGWLTPKGYQLAMDLGDYLRGKYVSDSQSVSLS